MCFLYFFQNYCLFIFKSIQLLSFILIVEPLLNDGFFFVILYVFNFLIDFYYPYIYIYR